MNLSKSRYTQGVTCSKYLWLSCYKPEEKEEENNDTVFDNGNKVGDLARGLFGDYTLIKFNDNYSQMIEDTKKELEEKTKIICEASFSFDGNFCAIDILKNDPDGVTIYEVKSSTELKNIYIEDVSYQTWVLNKLGFKIKKSFVVHVNNKYILENDFDINKYFVINDVTKKINLVEVEEKVQELKKVINSNQEPKIDLSMSCHKPYSCPFFKYCTKSLVKPNVFDVGWKLSFNEKLKMYYRNHISYQDLIEKEAIKNKKALAQIKSYLNNSKPIINKENIKKFLETITYPLYFLDFESYQDAIPRIIGTKPFQHICFQYSLHYYLEKNGEILHKEYLSDDYNGNPMYGLCKRLCEDIPKDVCVIVYNDRFEKARLREMAELFPEFREHLLNIREHAVDLWKPFDNQDYYVKEMGGSGSIKVVLPSLFPDDPECDYHNLEEVHKGDEASEAYLSLPTLSKEDQEKRRKNLLIYCGRDTMATVKLFEKLKEVLK